jgi:hypothetical protein
MNKYDALNKDIFSIFSSVGWTAESIKTFPENFIGTTVGNEYIRVGIVASSYDKKGRQESIFGQLLIDIFYPAGKGTARAIAIAGKLDDYLSCKTLVGSENGNTQMGVSTMTHTGVDKANASLYRSLYSISFSYFGK